MRSAAAFTVRAFGGALINTWMELHDVSFVEGVTESAQRFLFAESGFIAGPDALQINRLRDFTPILVGFDPG